MSKTDLNKIIFKDNKRRLQSAYKAGVNNYKNGSGCQKGRFTFLDRKSAAASAV